MKPFHPRGATNFGPLEDIDTPNEILFESSLSFLGLGDPNHVSWGYMIGASRSMLQRAWWLPAFPGIAILVTVLSINLVGDGLNDALNPRTTTMTPAAGAVDSPQVNSPLPESAPRAPVAAGR